MKLEDIKNAVIAEERIKNNTKAIENLEKILDENPNGNSDGRTFSSDKKLFGLYIHKHSDGSGDGANLSGSMVQTEIVQFAINKLKEQIKIDEEYIESL